MNTPGNTDQPTSNLDNQGCVPLEQLLAPDLDLEPSTLNSSQRRAKGGKSSNKDGSKAGPSKRITNSGGSTGRRKRSNRPKKHKKIAISKTSMLKGSV